MVNSLIREVRLKQIAVWSELLSNAVEDRSLGLDVEVDQDVADHHDVERRHCRPRTGQVQLLERDPFSEVLLDLSLQTPLLEVLDEVVRWETISSCITPRPRPLALHLHRHLPLLGSASRAQTSPSQITASLIVGGVRDPFGSLE